MISSERLFSQKKYCGESWSNWRALGFPMQTDETGSAKSAGTGVACQFSKHSNDNLGVCRHFDLRLTNSTAGTKS
jgi:hypothetical protein